uniref:Cap-specific mRNA (nucleoside-2'-O-)-methyltransferase 1 n=1 Tax=Macrostomum lignano TaxID=282301 RepID=A0A1I8ISP4_9PLAT
MAPARVAPPCDQNRRSRHRLQLLITVPSRSAAAVAAASSRASKGSPGAPPPPPPKPPSPEDIVSPRAPPSHPSTRLIPPPPSFGVGAFDALLFQAGSGTSSVIHFRSSYHDLSRELLEPPPPPPPAAMSRVLSLLREAISFLAPAFGTERFDAVAGGDFDSDGLNAAASSNSFHEFPRPAVELQNPIADTFGHRIIYAVSDLLLSSDIEHRSELLFTIPNNFGNLCRLQLVQRQATVQAQSLILGIRSDETNVAGLTSGLDPNLRYEQNGFRPRRGTVTQILELRRVIDERIRQSKLIIVFVDFRKASSDAPFLFVLLLDWVLRTALPSADDGNSCCTDASVTVTEKRAGACLATPPRGLALLSLSIDRLVKAISSVGLVVNTLKTEVLTVPADIPDRFTSSAVWCPMWRNISGGAEDLPGRPSVRSEPSSSLKRCPTARELATTLNTSRVIVTMATQSSDDDDSNAPPPMKRPRQSDASSAAGSLDGFSGPSKSMMKKMGYISGEGLGRERQGITEPVQAVTIKGRSGLGFESVSATSRPEFQWREGDDPVVVRRQVDWLTGGRDAPSVINNAEEMKLRWMSVGLAKMTLDDETGFVSPEVLTGVLECKTFLDSMSNKDLMDSRSRSNPYETVKNAIFMNRAAVKMAEVDAVLQFRMSQPFDSDEIFQFADICAGPGGFTEYLLWRNRAQDGRGPRAKGFGLTLRGECDFRLNDMLMGAPEFFYPYYGPTDQSHGDIYLEDNMLGFRDLIMANTANLGVHLVTADGGFSVEGQENIQEIRSKQLYLCQALTAMLVLRSGGGSFLCKLFDIFTEFSAGLMYLLYLAFDQFALFKPATSRPANSERYVICRGYRKQQSESIVQYLLLVNAEINLLKVEAVHLPQSERQDVQGLVSLDVLKADRAFSDYLTESNDTLGRMQIVGLSKIHHFYDNPGMKDTRQEDTRTECLQFWGIPDEKRGEKVLGKENPTVLISQLIGEGNMSKLLPPDASSSAKSVTADSLEKNPDFSPYEQRAIACGEVNKEVMLLYSRGNGSVLVYKPAE